MKRIYFIIIIILSACDPGAAPPAAHPDAAESVPTPAAPPGRAALAESPYATADLERGELLSLACRACHTLGAGENDLLGPNLHGIFGRPAASRAGFEYSQALRESGIVWTPRALDTWLAEPSRFIPGNSMAFAGFSSANDRRDLIAYLLRATASSAE